MLPKQNPKLIESYSSSRIHHSKYPWSLLFLPSQSSKRLGCCSSSTLLISPASVLFQLATGIKQHRAPSCPLVPRLQQKCCCVASPCFDPLWPGSMNRVQQSFPLLPWLKQPSADQEQLCCCALFSSAGSSSNSATVWCLSATTAAHGSGGPSSLLWPSQEISLAH